MISIWEKDTFFAPQDVVIIGSGFVGLWSAFYIEKKHPHLKVSILERGLIPTGASTRNAGFACFGSLSELVNDSRKMGEDKMLELVEMRFKGLERIQKHFPAAAIDFELCGGYELYDTALDLSSTQLQDHMEHMNKLLRSVTGHKKTFHPADEQLKAFGFKQTSHMVRNNFEGYLHSGKLLQQLLFEVQSMGVQVFNCIEVKTYDLLDDTIELTTNRQITFTTRQLLICTNAFAKELLPQAAIWPARGQVLVTSPLKNLPFKGTFHSDEGYYYFRNLGNRVLLGGARNKAFEQEETTDMQTSAFIQSELERYLGEVILPHYNDQYTIDCRWSGIMGMGAEKLPIVEQPLPHVYCAIRMSGMGVALAPVIGKKVASMLSHAL